MSPSDGEFETELMLLRENGIKGSGLRLDYEAKVRGLAAERDALLQSGLSVEEAARKLHDRRRELGKEYKDAAPPLFREYIFYATARKYGDPLGPSYEELRRTKTPEQILDSASRPIRDLDNRLTLDGFADWYHSIYRR